MNQFAVQSDRESVLILSGPNDGRLIDDQDRVLRLAYPNITQANNPDQLTMLQNLSGAIIRVEVLLSKYRR